MWSGVQIGDQTFRVREAAGSNPAIPTPRGVAQIGSVLEWGSRGRRFKSGRPDLTHRPDHTAWTNKYL